MDKFILNDIRDFCLCHLKNSYMKDRFLNDKYVPTDAKVFVWKILMCNKMLNLVNIDCNEYIEELQKSTPYNISFERRNEIWNFMLPIYEKLKDYSSLNFKPSDLYVTMSNNGYIKEEITTILTKSGAHSWTAYILPTTEKFWVEADCTFDEFCNRVHASGIPKELWDFYQNQRPELCDE